MSTNLLTSSISFSIPDFKISYFQKKIEKLNKRALKLNLPPLKVTADFNTPSSVRKVPNPSFPQSRTIEIPMYTVTVEGFVPSLDGWAVVATIDIEDGMTIVNSYLDHPIPDAYKNENRGHCEHCNTSRNRKKMVILQDQSGELIQVGRSCLKDFLSTSVEQELGLAESIASLYKEMDNFDPDEMLASCSFKDLRSTTTKAFELAAACIRTNGFVPSSSEDSMPTKVLMELVAFGSSGLSDELLEQLQKIQVTEEDKETALNVIDWILAADTKSDFMYNLNQIVNVEVIKIGLYGYVAGAVASYLKQQTQQKAQTIQFADAHLGSIKERLEVKNATILSIRVIDGYYGLTTVFNLRSEEGHSIVWFSTNGADLGAEGEKISFKATIKDHSEYKGTKQTVVNRLKKI